MEELNFDEMRSQIALLKNKLDEQEIVTDRLIRRTAKQRMGIVNWQGTKSIICGVFASAAFLLLYQMGQVSLPFTIATIALMIFCIAGTIYAHWPVWSMNLATDDLHTVASKLAQVKRVYTFWLHVVTPITIVPWISWYCYDYLQHQGVEMSSNEGLAFIFAMVFAGGVGALIGYLWHRKAINACDEIISDIES